MPSIELGERPDNRKDILKPWTQNLTDNTYKILQNLLNAEQVDLKMEKMVKTGLYAVSIQKLNDSLHKMMNVFLRGEIHA